jgi:hypothetical protein
MIVIVTLSSPMILPVVTSLMTIVVADEFMHDEINIPNFGTCQCKIHGNVVEQTDRTIQFQLEPCTSSTFPSTLIITTTCMFPLTPMILGEHLLHQDNPQQPHYMIRMQMRDENLGDPLDPQLTQTELSLRPLSRVKKVDVG